MTEHRKEDEILSNFSQFFGNLAQEFPVKDAYEIYRDKSKSATKEEDVLRLMKKAVIEARKMISKNTLERRDGALWINEGARPYMRMKKELAELYVNLNLVDEAIKEYFEILDLDTFDNLNIRGSLSNLLLKENRYDDFEKLITSYW